MSVHPQTVVKPPAVIESQVLPKWLLSIVRAQATEALQGIKTFFDQPDTISMNSVECYSKYQQTQGSLRLCDIHAQEPEATFAQLISEKPAEKVGFHTLPLALELPPEFIVGDSHTRLKRLLGYMGFREPAVPTRRVCDAVTDLGERLGLHHAPNHILGTRELKTASISSTLHPSDNLPRRPHTVIADVVSIPLADEIRLGKAVRFTFQHPIEKYRRDGIAAIFYRNLGHERLPAKSEYSLPLDSERLGSVATGKVLAKVFQRHKWENKSRDTGQGEKPSARDPITIFSYPSAKKPQAMVSFPTDGAVSELKLQFTMSAPTLADTFHFTNSIFTGLNNQRYIESIGRLGAKERIGVRVKHPQTTDPDFADKRMDFERKTK